MTITINGTTGLAGVDGSASTPAVQGSDTNTGVFYPAADTVAIATGGSERVRVDSSGNVAIGASSGGKLHVAGNFSKNTADENTWGIRLTDETAMAAGVGGGMVFGGNYTSGGGKASFGAIAGAKENSTTSNGLGQLRFYTTDSSSILQERVRIDSSGNLLVAKTAANSGNAGAELGGNSNWIANTVNGTCFLANRLTTDGTLFSFRQDSTEEGNISVSGTTVSYNGGHLSRWAQTTTPKDDSLVKGTVLSNLDEMNQYADVDGNPVPNEQLNKVKVSDVEGDPNVAGVFVNWTHDDAHDVDEINMAMTGDMIIRIAQGVTVQRGDLLMSAGDGTAKPQGDDIIRSKTVAKVTSNHVTCTYADGSYCVPCVLMAC